MDNYQYQHGRIAGVRFCDISRLVIELLPEVSHIAIRSLDSTVAIESLRHILNLQCVPFSQTNGNILISRESFYVALSKNVFTGYDELWFFQSEPSKDLFGLPRATSESEDFSVAIPTQVIDCMRETQCVLLIADGNGLNYITDNPAVIELLSLKSKRQP